MYKTKTRKKKRKEGKQRVGSDRFGEMQNKQKMQQWKKSNDTKRRLFKTKQEKKITK